MEMTVLVARLAAHECQRMWHPVCPRVGRVINVLILQLNLEAFISFLLLFITEMDLLDGFW